MSADSLTKYPLSQIFHSPVTEKYEIPYYQRGYDWKKKHVLDFWEDLKKKGDEANDHFFGFLYTQTISGENRKLVVDGQQRLTTSFLFHICLRDICERKLDYLQYFSNLVNPNIKKKEEKKLAQIKFSTRDSIKDQQKCCKHNHDEDRRYEDLRKDFESKIFFNDRSHNPDLTNPSLTLSRQNKNFCEKHILPRGTPVKKYLEMKNNFVNPSCNLLMDVYHLLTAKITQYIKYEDDWDYDKLTRLSQDLINLFYCYNIAIVNEDEAYEMFSTLNNRGIKLSDVDLIKHKIFFYLSEQTKNLTENDRDKKFEKYDILWNKVKDGISKNNYKFEKFIHHFLVCTVSQKIKISEIFQYMNKILNDDFTSEERNEIKEKLPTSASQLLDKIEEFSEVFIKILEMPAGHFSENTHPRIKWNLESIKKSTSIIVNHAIIPAYLKYWKKGDKDDFQNIVSMCFRNFIRNKSIGNISATQLEENYKEIGFQIYHNNISVDDIKDKLKSDNTYVEKLKLESDCKFRNWYTETWVTRYLLEEINATIGTGPFNSSPDVTIEHIMPKKLTDDWIKNLKAGKENDQEILEKQSRNLNKLGNLTLLSRELNTAQKNAIFAKKKEYFKNDHYKITQKVAKIRDWSFKEIQNRDEKILKSVLDILDIDKRPKDFLKFA